MDGSLEDPPRNGEGDRPAQPGGGGAKTPPPERARRHHRTMGASSQNVARARKLRKEMSLPEVLLWRELRGKRPKFRRQFPIAGYIADFACADARMIVEVDGFAHDTGDRPTRDEERARILEGKGWRVVRLAARRVLHDPVAAADAILRLAEASRPHHRPR